MEATGAKADLSSRLRAVKRGCADFACHGHSDYCGPTTSNLPHASNLVEAIRELKQENARFEMYLMLGAWMDCVGAWTDAPNHAEQDFAANQVEIERAVALAQEFPDIVKVIAVGNESMVRWATSYFVEAKRHFALGQSPPGVERNRGVAP